MSAKARTGRCQAVRSTSESSKSRSKQTSRYDETRQCRWTERGASQGQRAVSPCTETTTSLRSQLPGGPTPNIGPPPPTHSPCQPLQHRRLGEAQSTTSHSLTLSERPNNPVDHEHPKKNNDKVCKAQQQATLANACQHLPKNHRTPLHDVIVTRRAANPAGGVL